MSAMTKHASEYAYQYDDIGNRLSSLDLGTNRTYTVNSLNQYTSITGEAARPARRAGLLRIVAYTVTQSGGKMI